MQRRFVIHLHSGYGQLHYDLMLSHGQALATWQLWRPPTEIEPGQTASARRLPDHRVAYLTYEEPVSRGRGKVTMLDEGNYELLAELPDRWEFRLEGQTLKGCYQLVRSSRDPDAWTLRRLPED